MQFNKKWKEYLMETRWPDLLSEIRVRDVKAKYPNLDQMGWIKFGRVNIEDSLGPKAVSRYLMWYSRELYQNFKDDIEEYAEFGDALELDQENIREVADALLAIVFDFHSNVNNPNIEEKDIYKYDSGTLQYKLNNLGLSKRAKQMALRDREAAEENSKMVYNSHSIMAIRPLTTQASCYYGHNPKLTTWCISTKSERNYFDQYTEEEGKAFIITRFFGIPEGDPNHIIALELDYEGDVVMYHDAPNEPQDADDLILVILEHLEGLEEYHGMPRKEIVATGMVSKIHQELTRAAKEAVLDEPPPSPDEAIERACEKVKEEALNELSSQ